MPALFNRYEKVIFHFPEDLGQWPIDTRIYNKERAKKFNNSVCRVAARKWMLNSYYYVLEEIGNVWIKENFLESITPQITKDEFEKLLEV